MMSFSSEAQPINISVPGSQHRGGLAAFITKHKKPVVIVFLSSLLLVGALVAVATAVTGKSRHDPDQNVANMEASHALIRSSCSSTRFPDLCFSTLLSNTSLAASLTTQKEVIEASINQTILAVEGTYFKILKLIPQRNLTPREKTALHDCLENVDETLDELRETYEDLKVYPTKKSLSEQAEDLKILLSAAMTNQESCLDGFSHDDADKKVKKVLEKGVMHVHDMCSNALAMICNMTNTDIANEKKTSALTQERRLMDMEDDGFPSWLSAGDRRLLQSSSITPDVTVAAGDRGNYRTVAVAAAAEKSSKRYMIRIKASVYQENMEIPKKKMNMMFVGDDRKTTALLSLSSPSPLPLLSFSSPSPLAPLSSFCLFFPPSHLATVDPRFLPICRVDGSPVKP